MPTTTIMGVVGVVLGMLVQSCGDGHVMPADDDDAVTVMPANVFFVAVEEDGTVAAVDSMTGKLLKTIDVAQELSDGTRVMFDVHNVQAAPDGRMVWLTAMPVQGHAHAGHDSAAAEQLIGVDARTGRVHSRIELGVGLHAAHVVVGDRLAYVISAA